MVYNIKVRIEEKEYMKYSKLEKLGISPSTLGFGCMRFPKNEDRSINEPLAQKMLDEAIAQGVTYIDTAYPYHGGESERFVGKALKKYPRDSFYLATKLPTWLVKEQSDVEKYLNEQLEKLQTNYVDFYLIHAVNKDRIATIKDCKIIEEMIRLRDEGKIRYIGFSFHDDYEVFEEMINMYNWDFCQIQYNYVDTMIQAGDKGVALCEEKGIPLVIMEPIKGGSLAVLPDDIASMFKAYDPDASISSWALRFVASKKAVKVVLSGMSNYEHVVDNLATFNNFKPLNQEEEKLVEDVAKAIKAKTKNGCTGCQYCMPCPFGVNIPANFRFWNDYAMYGNKEVIHNRISGMEGFADQCKKCGKCEKMCPQSIKIREDLVKVVEEIGSLR